jgi:hypothetical protein
MRWTRAASLAGIILAALPFDLGQAEVPAKKEAESVKPIETEPHALRVLKAGTITAIVDLGREGAIYSPGSNVFAAVKLSSSTPKGEEVVVAVEADGGEIVSLTVKGGRIDDSQPRKVARVLVRGAADIQLVVEMKLKDAADRTGERLDARLKLAVSSSDPRQTAAKSEAAFTWAVADCAGNFHQRLAEIRMASLDKLPAALKAARTPDAALPAQWLFQDRSETAAPIDQRKQQGRPASRPEAVEHVSILYAVETVEERFCQSKNSSGDCIVWGTRTVQKRVPVDPFAPALAGTQRDLARQEKAVMALADQLVRSRGVISDLAATGRFSWVTARVSTDLRTFAGQPLHPAICTGSTELLDYFSANLVALSKQARSLQEAARAARQIAAVRVGLLATFKAAGVEPPLALPDSATDVPDRPLTALVGEMAERLLPSEDAKAVRRWETPITALAALKARLDALPATAAPDSSDRLVTVTLRAIEAAARIEMAERIFTAVDLGLVGSIAAMKSAHATTCVCNSHKP